MLSKHFHVVKDNNDKIFFLLSVDILNDEKFRDLSSFFPCGIFLEEEISERWGFTYERFPGYRGNSTDGNATSKMIKLCNLLNYLFPRKQDLRESDYEVLA